MRHVANLAVLDRSVNRLERQNFARMTTETIFIRRFDARMGLVALIAVEPRHGHPVGK